MRIPEPPRPPGPTPGPRALDIRALNAGTADDVVAALGPLFEGAPRFLGRVAGARPYADWDALFEVARAIAHGMPADEQIELIDVHPRLGAPPETVSAMSFREQGYNRLSTSDGAVADRPTPEIDVSAELDRLNAAYEARFGFRYCVQVAGRSREALLPEMAASLAADRDAELHRGLDAVIDIAAARLAALLVAG